jgi:hypothetical protein
MFLVIRSDGKICSSPVSREEAEATCLWLLSKSPRWTYRMVPAVTFGGWKRIPA